MPNRPRHPHGRRDAAILDAGGPGLGSARAGGDPRLVELLGERFLLWRDGEGRPGLFAEACLHRGASLQLARAEPEGLRCIYHGWKFAVDGKVLETPNIADPRFKERIKGRAFPVKVAGGLVWAYLGPRDKEPEFPNYPFMEQPDERRINVVAIVNCNYAQVIEGLVDSSHLTILHAGGLAATNNVDSDFAKKTTHMQFDASPDIEADETDFGFHYVALRAVGEAHGPHRLIHRAVLSVQCERRLVVRDGAG